jgi:hypothetical protein
MEDIDEDEMRAYEIDMTGVPARIFRPQEEIEEIRAARAQREAQNRMLQIIQGRGGRAQTNVQIRPGGTPAASEGVANAPGVAV